VIRSAALAVPVADTPETLAAIRKEHAFAFRTRPETGALAAGSLLFASDEVPYYTSFRIEAFEADPDAKAGIPRALIIQLNLMRRPSSPPPKVLLAAREKGRTADALIDAIGQVTTVAGAQVSLLSAELRIARSAVVLPKVVAPPIVMGEDVLELCGCEFTSRRIGRSGKTILQRVRWTDDPDHAYIDFELRLGFTARWASTTLIQEVRSTCINAVTQLT